MSCSDDRFSQVIRTQDDMHDYQNDAVDFVEANPFSHLFIDLGLGKTIISLTLLNRLIQSFEFNKALIIAPLRVATTTWPNEIPQWEHTAKFNYSLVTGNVRQREIATQSNTSIHIINRENVEWLVNHWKRRWPYDTVIIDECFVAGTLIETTVGGVPIEKINVGDEVLTPYGYQKVLRVISKRATTICIVHICGRAIECTPEHKFLTDKGWLAARDLSGRIVYGQSDEERAQVSALWGDLLSLEASEEVLQQVVQLQEQLGNETRDDVIGDCWNRLSTGAQSLEQRYSLGRGCEGKTESIGKTWRVKKRSCRKRPRHDRARGFAVTTPTCELDSQLRHKSRQGREARGLPDKLQGGFRLARLKARARSGWQQPQPDCSTAARPQEGEQARGIRVDSVESIQYEGGVNVFDITVEGAPFYYAGGVLVHNCSALKDHTTKRFKALKKVRPLIKRLHGLTATPASETYLHLFAQIYLLDQGERLGKSFTAFRDKYFNMNQYTYEITLKPGAADEIIEKISDICLVMKAEDYLDLQEPVLVEQFVHLDEQQLALYKQMEEDFVITLPDGTEIEAETAAALSQKLAAIASGFVYNTVWVDTETDGEKKQSRTTHHVHDHKLDKLTQLAEESGDEPLMVVYWHKASLERLKKVFPHAEVMGKSGSTLRRWNEKQIRMLLVHPASAGHGLNLQYGGHQIVFYDIPWSLELYTQVIGRLARQGQTKAVVVHHIIASGTIDEYVVAALRRKEDAQSLLFRKLKNMREKLTRNTAHQLKVAYNAPCLEEEL